MRILALFIFVSIMLLSGCSDRETRLLSCQEKEIKLGKIVLDETKDIIDETHPEFKDINNAYYMEMRCHDKLLLAKLNYVLINHPRKIKFGLGVPYYELNEKETTVMQNDVTIKKLIQEKAVFDLEYAGYDNKEEYWKYRKIEGAKILEKYKSQMQGLVKDWEKVMKLY